MTGHLFVVGGDITRLHCDAWLMPTDDSFTLAGDFAREGEKVRGRHRPWAADEQFRLLAPPAVGAPQVWLGRTGAVDAAPEWFGERAAAFVSTAAEAARNHAVTRRSLPLLALPVIGTRYGGGDWREKGAILAELVSRLTAAAAEHEVDVALVTWGSSEGEARAIYAAAQRARREHAEPSSANRALEPSLVDAAAAIAQRARSGNLVLFIGAGVSAGAGLPTWQALLEDLAEKAGFGEQERAALSALDPRDQASIIARRNPEYRKQVGEAIQTARYPLTAGLLASLPTTEAITTNYDELFEAAVGGCGQQLAVLPYHPVTDVRQRWLLKLHGTAAEGAADIVLTREDYLGAPARHAALFGLVQAMLLTRHMLFVGYSLSDDDFHRVIHDVRLALPEGTTSTVATALTLFDDPLQGLLWKDTIDVIAMSETSGDATSTATAARSLEIFLDLICAEASDLTAFLLSGEFDHLLDDAEQATAQALRELNRTASSGPVAPKVAELLKAFGAPGRP